MNTADSLSLIEGMIAEAKKSFHRTSTYFLIWGVVLTLCGIGEHILVFQMGLKQGYAIWGVLGAVGGIASMIYSMKESKRQRARSYHDTVYQYLWGAFGVTLLLILVGSVPMRVNPTPYIMIATGIPTFTSGGLLKFRPLIFGGIVFWALGLLCFYIPVMWTGLVFSLAIVLGYLIPGILLNKQEKQNS